MILINKKIGRIEINTKAIFMGEDLCLIITGGDTPHLGAVTTLSDAGMDTLSFGKHKERFITESVSEILKEKFRGNLVICCGIHLNNITMEEIKIVKDMCNKIGEELSQNI